MTSIKETIKHFLEDEKNSIVFNFKRYGRCTAATFKKGLPARISIEVPKEVCGEDLRDLDKWRIFLIAIKEVELEKLIGE